MMPILTRRDFLATTSLALAGTVLGVRGLQAQILPAALGGLPLSANSLLPESLAPAMLHTLATSAVDAARRAGASYADVRVAEQYKLRLALNPALEQPGIDLNSNFTYGVRVLVDGAWAFAYGTAPTVDALSAAARNAVASARGYAKLATQRIELAPAPVVTGEWDTPVKLDPFTVPLQDQTALMHAYRGAIRRVLRGTEGTMMNFDWSRETRVFASSEGSLTTQVIRRSNPLLRVAAHVGMDYVDIQPPSLVATLGGYETVAIPGFQDELKNATEEALRLSMLPRRLLDVGRYPVVFDGVTLGATFGRTIGPALDMDRVLGYESDTGGTSFLSPPDTVLGTTIVSPLLTVTGHHAPAVGSSVKWDDEGVELKEFPLITNGRLVDYYTSRSTAPALRAWYERQGKTLQSHGCAMALEAKNPVMIRPPYLTIAPSSSSASLEDLCKDITRGLLIREVRYVDTDPRLMSAVFTPTSIFRGGEVFEIEKGKVVRRMLENGVQFNTQPFWKNLLTLGDARTVRHSTFDVHKGQSLWAPRSHGFTAPAGLFKEVDVISTGWHMPGLGI